jgi:hypothetical protein
MKTPIDSLKKYLIVSCTTILIFGAQGPVSRKIASLEPDCLDCTSQQPNNDLLRVISKLVDSQSGITGQLQEDTGVFNPHLYSKRGYFLHSQFKYTTYTLPPLEKEFTDKLLENYNSQVDALKSFHEERRKMAWSPEFGDEGEITNPFYGFGSETSQGIKQMYQFPTEANSIIGWTPPSQDVVQVPEQASTTAYYPQSLAI